MITLTDIEHLYCSINIPKLTEFIVDEAFCFALEHNICALGLRCKYVSLSDIGYISIAYNWYDTSLFNDKLNDIVDCINSTLKECGIKSA